MFYLEAKGFAETACFKIPDIKNKICTLPAPLPTTIMGLLGRSQDLPYDKTIEKFESLGIDISFKYENKFNDLVKYYKYQGSAKNCKTGTSDVMQKEYLQNCELVLVLSSENKVLLDELKESLINPLNTLYLGNSENMFMFNSCEYVESFPDRSKTLKNTVIEGNLLGKFTYSENAVRGVEIHLLPSKYNVLPSGYREVVGKRTYTFVRDEIIL